MMTKETKTPRLSSRWGLWKTCRIEADERALLHEFNTPARVLRAGEYRFFDPRNSLSLEVFKLGQPLFRHAQADWLRAEKTEWLESELLAVETGANELAWVRYDGRLADLLPARTRALYWRGFVQVTVERVSLDALQELPQALLRELATTSFVGAHASPAQLVMQAEVPAHATGVLTVDEKDIRLLAPGRYGFYKSGRSLNLQTVDLREQALEISGQEILTADKVALRLTVGVSWKITDVLTCQRELAKPGEQLYREIQFALRQVVGTRSLDALLENKSTLDREVQELVADKLARQGITLTRVGLKDIILPGDMKAIMTRVVEAEKAAMANVIRRREETSATRSLLNTARVMEDNPVALRLKELETLERITEKIGHISVYGGLEGILQDLVKLAPGNKAPEQSGSV
jgi:regulator of protease activity HflC (stomatin/prohibitin superfamily)